MHPRNTLRLLAGIPIDPSLEVTQRIDEDHFKKGQKVKDGKNYDWIILSSTGSGDEEVYKVKCPKTGDIKTFKATQLHESSSMDFDNSKRFKDGDKVLFDNGIYIVVVADPRADKVGIIPAGMAKASANEKNRSVIMVAPDKLRKPSAEEEEVMQASTSQLSHVDDNMAPEYARESVERRRAGLKKVIAESRAAKKKLSEEFYPEHPNTWESTGSTRPTNVVAPGNAYWPTKAKGEAPTQLDKRGDQSMTDYEDKVEVPNEIKEALRSVIKEFEGGVEEDPAGHTAEETSILYADTVAAFKTLLAYLEEGTIQSIKRAQIFASSLMGPMMYKLPSDVWNFIVHGGQGRSLKGYMNKVSQ